MGGCCATGSGSGPIAESFYELSALDINEKMLNFADWKGKVCYESVTYTWLKVMFRN
jgi:ubiquinone/menaquinone biosynthesis C-methylase UbiE